MNLPTILFLMLWNLAPLSGLATWYGPPLSNDGDIMRNGEALSLSAHTIAVDASHLDWLNMDAVVLTECGGVHLVRVTDTGPLYKAGYFRLGISRFTEQLRYWPVVEGTPVLTDTVEWQENTTHRVVADFPRQFFMDEIACSGNETPKVRIWIPCSVCYGAIPNAMREAR